MEFSKDDLENIMMLGTVGKTFSEVAKLFGLRPDQLRDLRAINPELNEALDRFQYNYDLFRMEEMERSASNVKSKIGLDYFKMLKESHDKRNDNEIIIREVE